MLNTFRGNEVAKPPTFIQVLLLYQPVEKACTERVSSAGFVNGFCLGRFDQMVFLAICHVASFSSKLDSNYARSMFENDRGASSEVFACQHPKFIFARHENIASSEDRSKF